MMENWVAALPALGASIGILLVPGLLVAALIGLRGLWLLATAPAISLTMFVVGSVVLPVLGLEWNPFWAFTVAAVFGAVVVVLFRNVLRARFAFSAEGEPDPRELRRRETGLGWPTVVAWALTAVPVFAVIAIGIASPTAISHTYDNIFHLNLIAHTLETGNASPLVAGTLTTPEASISFYPNSWHALVALVCQLSGASVPIALNAFNIAAAVLIWPTVILLLVRQLVGASRAAMLATGVLAGGLTAFPLNLLYYGVLYPFFLGTLLVPLILALVLQVLNVTRSTRITGSLGLFVLLLGLLPGISLAHPGATMGVLALSVPLVLVAVFAGFRALTFRIKLWRCVGLGAYLIAGLLVLIKLRPTYTWSPRISMLEAAERTATLALQGYGLPVVIAALMVFGIIVSLGRRRPSDLAAVGMWLVGALMFFVAAGVPFWRLRAFTVGVWYADMSRLAAFYAIALLPVAIIGAVWLVERFNVLKPKASLATGAGMVALCLLGVHLTAGWNSFLPVVRDSYTADADSKLLSADELAILDELPELVPEGSVVAGNPWTGTALAYALSGREVIMPHVQTRLNADETEIMLELRWADERPEVCEAVRNENVGYVLDFGEREVHGGDHSYPGIEDLATSGAVEVIATEGDAKLYRVVACTS